VNESAIFSPVHGVNTHVFPQWIYTYTIYAHRDRGRGRGRDRDRGQDRGQNREQGENDVYKTLGQGDVV